MTRLDAPPARPSSTASSSLPPAQRQGDAIVQTLLARALEADKPARLQVQGQCMEPLIRDGDWVEIRPDRLARVGSIVLARASSGELVCHRVLARHGDMLSLAGDRSLTAEELSPDCLLGVVRSIERGGATRWRDGWWTRGPDRMLAVIHRLSLRTRGLPPGRLVEGLRGLLLTARSASRGTSQG